MKNSIEVSHVSKAYQHNKVVNDINFQVRKGEIFAFLGPNGAGKSTTIAMLCTLLSIDSGDICIEGNHVGVDNAGIRKDLGVVFQDSMLDGLLSVHQNLILRCGLYGLFGTYAQQRVAQLCDICQLQEFQSQRVSTLSGGQRRRVDIARALIPNPHVLILDEPSSGLDPKSRKLLWDTIIRLHDEYHMTVFLTTHYLEEAEIADHICMIQKGSIILDGEREQLKQIYGQEQLLLYSDTLQNIINVLQKHRIAFIKETDCLRIDVLNFYQIMSILRKCEIYIHHIELVRNRLEDMYLKLLEETT